MEDVSAAQRKEELRLRAAELLAGVSPESREDLAESIWTHLEALPAFTNAGVLGIWYATGAQVPTLTLIIRLVEQEGRRVFLPFVQSDELRLTEWRPAEPVTQGDYVGIQPRYCRATSGDEVKAFLVPGLLFDRRGNRLGSGRGLYDRLLAALPPDAVKIGVAFHVQLFDDVPMDGNDVAMDYVATEQGVIACTDAARAASDSPR